jgi:hypothetical protein
MNVHATASATEHRFDDATSAFAGDVIEDLAKHPSWRRHRRDHPEGRGPG